MATNFPTSLDNTDSQKVVDGTNVIVAALPNNLLDMIKALQAKVGVNGSAVQSSIDFFIRKNYVKVSHRSTGLSGGGFGAGAWRTRTLNTEDNDDGSLCSLSSNQITLVAGTYYCHIICSAHGVDQHLARLHNVTDDTELIRGMAATADYSTGGGCAIVAGQFTVGSSKALEVQHYCNNTNSNYGFGRGVFSASDNVYCMAEFWKLY